MQARPETRIRNRRRVIRIRIESPCITAIIRITARDQSRKHTTFYFNFLFQKIPFSFSF